jgi:transposase-like protein/IS1 family transposase
MVKAGFYGRNRVQRWKCQQCGKRFAGPQERPFGADLRLPRETIELILRCLVEGNSIRSTARLCDVEKRTVLNILTLAGESCERIMGRLVVNVPVKDVQVDEIWGYVYKKEAHKLPDEAHDDGIGDAYCFVAIERNTKLVLNFALGRRSQATTDAFIEGLRAATSPQRFQISADGFKPYVSAITTTLGDRCDFAQVIKVYASDPEGQRRYSPADVTHTERIPIMGSPDAAKICTSHVERQNLTIRMQMRRLTRLTNAFSKKWENLWAAYCLHFAWYNFIRVHQTLRVTPAMEAGITNRVWGLADLLAETAAERLPAAA